MVAAQTPTLAKIKNEASEIDARALLFIAICEVCDFFNVGKNMNDTQIAVTVDLILESFWYLKLEEIKYCFRRAMQREKLFDRLDGNIILGWIRTYDAERTEEAIRMSEQEAAQEQSATLSLSEGTMTFRQYLDHLEEQAADGKGEALVRLQEIRAPAQGGMRLISETDRREKEKEFKQFYYDYLRNHR